MSHSPFDNGDPPVQTTNGNPEYQTDGAGPEVTDGSDHHANRGTATPVTDRGTAEKLDRRLRGLHIEQKEGFSAGSSSSGQVRRRRRSPSLAKWAAFVALAALAVLLLQAFVIQPFAVPGDAMAPTLQSGDRILVLKSSLLAGSIHSGEIIVFHPPKSLPCSVFGRHSGDLVLRVVALPGDVIWSARDTIFVDGRPLREPGWYDPRLGQVGSTPIRSTTLGAGQYYVLADNRADACDSRAFGPISRSSVVGEAIAIVGRHGHVSFGTL